MLRFKNRKGAIAVIVGVLMMALMMIAAVAVDVSRLHSIGTTMQTIADAASLAGTRELQRSLDEDAARVVAETYAADNQISNAIADVEVTVGRWAIRDGVWGFEFGPMDDPGDIYYTDAVRVTARHTPASYLMAGILGRSPVELTRMATGWASSFVNDTECFKPWSVPYNELLDRISAYRGIPAGNRDLTGGDIIILAQMPEAARTFELYLGESDDFEPGTVGGIALPSTWKAATGVGVNVNRGANDYRDNIAASNCDDSDRIAVGDWVAMINGNKVGPTLAEAPALIGEQIKVVLWDDALEPPGLPGYCSAGKCKRVRTIAYVRVLEVEEIPKNKARITAVFEVAPANGPVGNVSTTMLANRVILVR